METIINTIVSKLLDQRKDLIYELKNLDPHLSNYTQKRIDLSSEINIIDSEVKNHLFQLSNAQKNN